MQYTVKEVNSRNSMTNLPDSHENIQYIDLTICSSAMQRLRRGLDWRILAGRWKLSALPLRC
ncbi:MAG: hypothetical protein ABL887_01215 [Nitrosomonas sp.]